MRREHIVNQIREIVHRVAPTALAILYGQRQGEMQGKTVILTC